MENFDAADIPARVDLTMIKGEIEMIRTLSFYDWCAVVWRKMHQRYAFDDATGIHDDIEIWRQAWLSGELAGEFACGYAEERCYLDPLDSWTGARTDEPYERVPFPMFDFDERDLISPLPTIPSAQQLDLFKETTT